MARYGCDGLGDRHTYSIAHMGTDGPRLSRNGTVDREEEWRLGIQSGLSKPISALGTLISIWDRV